MSKTVSLEDWVAIRNLLGKYQWLVDEGDSEGWANLFTPDGAFIGGLPDPHHGHEELKKIPKLVKDAFGNKLRHLSGNHYIEYGNSKDQAWAKFYSFVTTWIPEQGPQFFQFSLCNVELLRINGEWKIKANNVINLKQ
jgi:hypothetical protein